jgi:hypothetical protein
MKANTTIYWGYGWLLDEVVAFHLDSVIKWKWQLKRLTVAICYLQCICKFQQLNIKVEGS